MFKKGVLAPDYFFEGTGKPWHVVAAVFVDYKRQLQEVLFGLPTGFHLFDTHR
jgi:hypothetical protein